MSCTPQGRHLRPLRTGREQLGRNHRRLPCVRYAEIYTTHSDHISSFSAWISPVVASTLILLRRGDLLFAGSGETKEEIGKCVAFLYDGPAYAGGDIVILRPTVEADSMFLGDLLNMPSVVRQKASPGRGDAVVHISANALGDIEVDSAGLSLTGSGLRGTIHFYPEKDKIPLFWIKGGNRMIAYHRTALAQQLVQALQGKALLGDAHNGLFLAAPRRTGKSTFLQGDLAPALRQVGVEVVYVDLWADTRRDPGALIAEAIAQALQAHLGLVARTARKAGVTSVKVAGALDIDTRKIGQVDGLTLVDALRSLHQAAGRPVALIVDEAQHALTSEAGEVAMTALKSARDQMNQPDRVNLMLVMSGSDRDKLLRLVVSAGAPFYGSQIQALPPLDTDFIAHVAGLVEAQRPDLVPVDRAALQAAFAAFGHRPQFFMAAMGAVLSPLSGHSGRFEPALQQAAQDRQAQDEAQMGFDYLGLKPTEQVVLWRMLDQGQRFRPYDAEALRFYREKLGRPVSVQQAQKALESLRQRTPALVWKSARGEYAVEDAAMHRWFEARLAAAQWPPASPQGMLALDED